jgi:hypothetical protein
MNPVPFPAQRHWNPRSASAPAAAVGQEDTVQDNASVVVASDPTKDHPVATKRTSILVTFGMFVKRRIPMVQRFSDRCQRIPPKYRYGCFFCWLVYKVTTAVLFVVVLHHQVTRQPNASSANEPPNGTTAASRNKRTLTAQSGTIAAPTKILYIVTSLSEYNNGRRNTIAGQDRLGDIVLPILVDSVESMVDDPQFHYQVDVYMILAYSLRPERERRIREQLPPRVGLEIWDDACPLGYDAAKSADQITNNTRALARQHRYVIKDKLPYYDLFVAFEDDMRITGTHVQHFLALSNELEVLRRQARTSDRNDETTDSFFGAMTPRQLDRLIPGFVRVEVLLNEAAHGAQLELDPIPLDYSVETGQEVHFNPQPCCHVQMNPNVGTPIHPEAKDVIVWETSIQALSVRQLPERPEEPEPLLDWVALLPGPGKRLHADDLISSFWSGQISQNGIWKVKPSPGQPDLIAQQGGWMATKEQIVRLNHPTKDKEYPQLCQGSFLPPFDAPIYRKDGQESMNVELYVARRMWRV